ncbi:hypothetical protein C8034_v003542 [Colletotrichum sidae]|uniref:Uncharacterized protein n=1 Tax=Colletotrichum sidae TaxID=1347389 RepID=A0A4V3I2E8_9PEZI|nr:hypothetical protein C8034_v003542 [Colletotrichum sidae]
MRWLHLTGGRGDAEREYRSTHPSPRPYTVEAPLGSASTPESHSPLAVISGGRTGQERHCSDVVGTSYGRTHFAVDDHGVYRASEEMSSKCSDQARRPPWNAAKIKHPSQDGSMRPPRRERKPRIRPKGPINNV